MGLIEVKKSNYKKDIMKTIINKWQLVFLLFLNTLSLTPSYGQTVVDSIIRPGLAPGGMAVYEKGNKLCVFDDRTNHLLIYDGDSFALLQELEFSEAISDPFSFLGMIVDENKDELYIQIALSGVSIAIVDLIDDSILTEIPLPGLLPQTTNKFMYDQVLNKIFTGNLIVDLDSNTVSQNNLLGGGILNPVTHEVFGTNSNTGKLRIINLITQQVAEVDAVKNVFSMTLNWLENKVYIISCCPYAIWIYDRDDGSTKTFDYNNDSEYLHFNLGSNLVYTDAQISCQTTIIDGSTDNYFNLPMMGATSTIGFRYSTKHAYFVHSNFIGVYDETTQMFEKIQFNNPHDNQGGGNKLIAMNQTTGRVYVSHVQLYNSPDYNPIWVLQDAEMMTRPNVILHDIAAKKYTFFFRYKI
jgi:hypothetical protein